MLHPRSVACFAVDARLSPNGIIGIGFEIIIARQLRDMAHIAGSVECIIGIFPVDGFFFNIPEVPDPACRRIKPGLSVYVIGERQNLQSASIHGCKKVINVLSAHGIYQRVFSGVLAGDFLYPCLFAVKLHPVSGIPYGQILTMRNELCLEQFGREGLHGETVVGRSP